MDLDSLIKMDVHVFHTGGGGWSLVKAPEPVTLIEGSGVRFPAVTIRRSARQASRPILPLCVKVKCY